MAKSKPRFTRVAQLKSVEDFRNHLSVLDTVMPFKDTLSRPGQSSLGQSLKLKSGKIIGNRFCILPMEGWDGTPTGLPSEHTKRRWRHFATSGAKLLWGCEAVAVRHDGRANPNQLMINRENVGAFKSLYQALVVDHEMKFGSSSDLLIGLQLTHSGRFSVPDLNRIKKPKIVYRHPLLDDKFRIPKDFAVLSDGEIDTLVDDFITAASLAKEAGFQFVDIKHCHGYLGHEFLSAYDRAGKYGGSWKIACVF